MDDPHHINVVSEGLNSFGKRNCRLVLAWVPRRVQDRVASNMDAEHYYW